MTVVDSENTYSSSLHDIRTKFRKKRIQKKGSKKRNEKSVKINSHESISKATEKIKTIYRTTPDYQMPLLSN